MVKKLFILLVSVLMVTVGCQKQESPEVGSISVRSIDEQRRAGICTNANFFGDVLTHRNTANLFGCLGWDREFPDLYAAISDVEPSYWNHMMAPINELLFSDRVRRDRLFSYLKSLDAAGGLDDLSRILTVLNETNFYDSLNDAFSCATKVDTVECNEREDLLSRSDIYELLSILTLDPEFYSAIHGLLKDSMSALEGKEAIFQNAMRTLVFTNKFQNKRVDLVTELLKKIGRDGISEKDRNFLIKLFLVTKTQDKVPWLKRWIESEDLDVEKFRELVRYPLVTNPKLIKDQKVVYQYFDQGAICTAYSSDGDFLVLDLKNDISELGGKLADLPKDQFFDYLLHKVNQCSVAAEFCPIVSSMPGTINVSYPEEREIQHEANVAAMLADMSAFLEKDHQFSLMKFLFYLTTREPLDESLRSPLYLVEMMNEKFFDEVLALNYVIDQRSPVIWDLTYEVLKEMSPESFFAVASLTAQLSSEKYRGMHNSLAKLWRFFNEEERRFIFKFMDTHFTGDSNFKALVDFYINALGEMPKFSVELKDQWAGTPDRLDLTYNSLENLVSHLSGTSVLLDFKRFFSRDHIIKLLKILSQGVEPPPRPSPDVFRDGTIGTIPYRPFEFSHDSSTDPKTRDLLKCMTALTKEGIGFYNAVIKLPQDCEEIESDNLSYRLFSWANNISKDYSSWLGREASSEDGLFDMNGILSRDLLNSSVAMMKVIDTETKGPDGKQGLSYILEVFRYYLLDIERDKSICEDGKPCRGLLSTFERFLRRGVDVLDSEDENATSFRHSLIRSAIDPDKSEHISSAIDSVTSMLERYADWVEGDEKTTKAHLVIRDPDPQYNCENFLSAKVGINPCPSKEEVKSKLKTILHYAKQDFNDNGRSAAGNIFRAVIPGEGIPLPLDGPRARNYRLSLVDLFSMIYDTTDKRHESNRLPVRFIDKETGSKEEVVMTTAERVEVVVRNIAFDAGYLGANYMNSVAKAEDYNHTVKQKRQLFSTCTGLKFCGKFMSSEQHRMAKNAVASFNGLLEVNTVFGHKDPMQGVLAILVNSSHKPTQRSSIGRIRIGGKVYEMPWVQTKKQLEKHNVQLLIKSTELAGISHIGRLLHDRVGRTRAEFDEFITSDRFIRISNSLFRDFPVSQAETKIIKIIDKLEATTNADGETLLDTTIDWISGLNYEESVYLESFLGRVLSIVSYLGSPYRVLDADRLDNLSSEDEKFADILKRRFHGNNLYKIIDVLDLVLDHWVMLHEGFPEDVKLIDAIKPLDNFLAFVEAELTSSKDLLRSESYLALNDLFVLTDNIIFTEHGHTFGLNIILSALGKKISAQDLYEDVAEGYDLLKILHSEEAGNEGEKIRLLAQNLSSVVNNEFVDMNPLRKYLFKTTVPCYGNNSVCESPDNYHYDEPINLMKYLLVTKNGLSNFTRLAETLIRDEYNNLKEMLETLSQLVSIQRRPSQGAANP